MRTLRNHHNWIVLAGGILIGGFAYAGNQGTTITLDKTASTTNFKIPGNHPTTDLILLNGAVTIHVTCPDNTIQNVVIPLNLQTYTDPLNSSAWYPTSVQSDPAGFQGSAQVPSTLCGGQSGVAATGATFSGNFSSIPVG